jgi:hypothetical protein
VRIEQHVRPLLGQSRCDLGEGDLLPVRDGGICRIRHRRSSWFRLDASLRAATRALEDVNNFFQKKIDTMKESLKGVAGDAFQERAGAILHESRELWRTITDNEFAKHIGDNGHTIRVFVAEHQKVKGDFASLYEEAREKTA